MKKHHKIEGISGLSLFALDHKDKPKVALWQKLALWAVFGALYILILLVAGGKL